VVLDAVARHLEGALGHAHSAEEESFSPALDGGLEYPHYTRPESFRGWEVPAVLRSGDHGAVARWRRDRSQERTRAARAGEGSAGEPGGGGGAAPATP
jgi:tRNA (guanine37-N1)-methyltransferase